MPRARWYLRHPDGSRRPIAAAGVLLGRSSSCEVVLPDPAISRRQAVIYLASGGPHLVVLGSAPCMVDGSPVARSADLARGATVGIGTQTFTVESESAGDSNEGPWMLQRVGGGLFGLSRSPFAVGGGQDDDLLLDDLPAGAVIFHSAEGRIAVEAATAGVRVDGVAVPEGEIRSLRQGSTVAAGFHEIRVAAGGSMSDATTRAGPDQTAQLPTRAALEFLPRGGRLTLRVADREISAYLAGRRCDLAASLLQPRPPEGPGDYVPDPVLADMVWPKEGRGRTDINTLVYRLRRDLLRAGADGCAIVQREEGGGATRLSLAPGAEVTVG